MTTEAKLYAQKANGERLEVIRRKPPFGTHPGIWWCPHCDWSQQDTSGSCGNCGAVLDVVDPAPPSETEPEMNGTAATQQQGPDVEVPDEELPVAPPADEVGSTATDAPPAAPTAIPYVGGLTVTELREALPDFSETQITAMLEAERTDRGRTTAIEAMEDALEDG